MGAGGKKDGEKGFQGKDRRSESNKETQRELGMGAGQVSGTRPQYGMSGDQGSTSYTRARLGTVGNGLDLQVMESSGSAVDVRDVLVLFIKR